MLPSRSLSSRTISALLECPESDISNCSISSDQQRSRCEESEEVFLLLCATAAPRRATEPQNTKSFVFIEFTTQPDSEYCICSRPWRSSSQGSDARVGGGVSELLSLHQHKRGVPAAPASEQPEIRG